MIEIRREQEPGDDIVAAADKGRRPLPAGAPSRGRKADEVLFEHH
jgi:hypothetical protein